MLSHHVSAWNWRFNPDLVAPFLCQKIGTGVGMKKNGGKTANAHMRKIGKKTQFSSTNQPKNPGRKKKWANVISGIPDDAQEKIYGRLYQALLCESKDEAMEILNAKGDELGEYGFVLQIAARALASKDGMGALGQILERLFGKAPQANINIETNADDETRDRFIKGIFIP